ncbi:MAG: helix-turn-helix domain-containing protein [Syntrophobacteraceae bacterium]
MAPRYRVTLTEQERQELDALNNTAKTNANRFLYARALLLCDAGPFGPAWTVADTAEAMGVTPHTIEHLKKRFVDDGLAAALERRQPEQPHRAR